MSALSNPRLLLVLLICQLPLLAEAQRAIGWHWYNEPQVTPKQVSGAAKPLSATQQMQALRHLVREAKDRAILFPTEVNLRAYISLQNFVIKQAAKFTQVWQKTLLAYPELDYSIQHPTQGAAQQVLHTQTHQQEDLAIKQLGQQYGILFFYRGQQQLDQELAPTIVAFCQTHQIALLPITVDGQTLPLLTNSQVNQQQAATLGIKHFPALILVDPKTQATMPLHYGFISESGLRQRFLQLMTNFNEEKADVNLTKLQ